MQDFRITLKNEKERTYHQLSWFIIAINTFVFISLTLFSVEKKTRIACIASLVLLACCFVLRHYLRKSKWKPGVHPFFLILMVGWISMEQYWIAVIPLVFDILSTIALRKLVVGFTNEKITYPSFPVQHISWNELSNVVLKDELLTIDFKNNRMIQQYTDPNIPAVVEREFNDFCRQQLITSNQQPIA